LPPSPSTTPSASCSSPFDADDLVGTATLLPPGAPPEWREKTPEDGATLRMVAVSPAARGRGIGTALTMFCIDRTRERGWPQLCLLTAERMHAAQRIYSRLGFTRDSDLDWQIPPGLLMAYSLDVTP
jgi:ribosomal protein S18 acetylase RimI-like enzyme